MPNYYKTFLQKLKLIYQIKVVSKDNNVKFGYLLVYYKCILRN
ncbi:hypothetical protein BN1318_140001 [Staphylococcus capitis]|nr:hypothetical protein BN1318_140001 [Staphylococcus capitis]